MDDLDLHIPPRMPVTTRIITSFRIVESQPKPFLKAKSNQWLGLTSKRIPFHLGHFQRYLLVGGLVFSVMSLPLFNEFCELRRAPWRWDFCQGLGDMTLASSKLEEDFDVFFVFFPQESLNIEHLLILPQHKRHLVKIPLDILTADGGHCVRTLHSKSQGCLGVEFRCH